MCAVAALIPAAMYAAQGLMQAKAATDQGDAEAEANNQNAANLRVQAADAIKRGEFDSDQQRLQTRAAIGTQRAGFAGNGVDVNSGSAAQVQDDTAALGEMDALTIKTNAAREAWGYTTQADQYAKAAKNAKSQARTAAYSSLLSAGAKAYGAYSDATGGASGASGRPSYNR